MSDDTDIIDMLVAEGSELSCAAANEIRRLRRRLLGAEAELAATLGTLRAAEPEPPFTVRDETPNVPR